MILQPTDEFSRNFQRMSRHHGHPTFRPYTLQLKTKSSWREWH